MDWLATVDAGAFRFVHHGLKNALFDWLMPVLSGHPLFFPIVLVAAGWLLWKSGTRGRLCVLLLVLVLPLGDGLVCNTLKHALARPRPFAVLEGVHTLVGQGSSGSMPSAHAANWFAATMVFWFYYRRSWRFLLPMAALVAFSRVYNGVHYPSDVLAGAILGAGYAVAGIWALDAAWRAVGRRWFPLWWEKLPALVPPFPAASVATNASDQAKLETRNSKLEQHWVRAGYVVILLLLAARLAYIAGDTIQLAEDEAYQWVWSKHLALSYYSKPPMIAYTQFLGTTLWGDTQFGVRFFSPMIGALLSLVLLRFMAREISARAGFFLLLIVATTPLLAVGSTLMTIDPLSVLFWTLAMLAGWRAVQPNGNTGHWAWVGLWMGLGFLSKYTALLQWLCWAVFFVLWRPARAHLRRPGPYLALGINALCSLPVLIWNWQHGWITVSHVAGNASLGKEWHFTLKYLGEFLGAEFGLWNPYWFVAAAMAAILFWRQQKGDLRLVYLFSMGAPLFLCYLLFSFYARVLPNWIAPSILPLLCLMVAYWHNRWPATGRLANATLVAGFAVGLLIVVPLHDTRLIARATGFSLPRNLDPLHRVRGWREATQLAGEARRELLKEGKPVILIGGDYGITAQMTFYLAEARAAVRQRALVYCQTTPQPRNQFYFWPGYTGLKGVNAIFVKPCGIKTSLGDYLKNPGSEELQQRLPEPRPAPPELLGEFASVTSLGVFPAPARGWPQQWVQLYACRDLQ